MVSSRARRGFILQREDTTVRVNRDSVRDSIVPWVTNVVPALMVRSDFRESLARHRAAAPEEVDFDLVNCTWEDVLVQLERANNAASESESREGIRGRIRQSRRWIFNATEVLGPGLAAIPDELCILHGGLAAIFSVDAHLYRRHLERVTDSMSADSSASQADSSQNPQVI